MKQLSSKVYAQAARRWRGSLVGLMGIYCIERLRALLASHLAHPQEPLCGRRKFMCRHGEEEEEEEEEGGGGVSACTNERKAPTTTKKPTASLGLHAK
jgi:hypothetical protein